MHVDPEKVKRTLTPEGFAETVIEARDWLKSHVAEYGAAMSARERKRWDKEIVARKAFIDRYGLDRRGAKTTR